MPKMPALGTLSPCCLLHVRSAGRESCAPIAQVLEFTHFACTSEDINNLAHGLMLRDAVTEHLLACHEAGTALMCSFMQCHHAFIPCTDCISLARSLAAALAGHRPCAALRHALLAVVL